MTLQAVASDGAARQAPVAMGAFVLHPSHSAEPPCVWMDLAHQQQPLPQQQPVSMHQPMYMLPSMPAGQPPPPPHHMASPQAAGMPIMLAPILSPFPASPPPSVQVPHSFVQHTPDHVVQFRPDPCLDLSMPNESVAHWHLNTPHSEMPLFAPLATPVQAPWTPQQYSRFNRAISSRFSGKNPRQHNLRASRSQSTIEFDTTKHQQRRRDAPPKHLDAHELKPFEESSLHIHDSHVNRDSGGCKDDDWHDVQSLADSMDTGLSTELNSIVESLFTQSSRGSSLRAEISTEERRLEQRQKQIDYGKNTPGYQRYIQTVPKNSRRRGDPETPDKYAKCSKRAWDAQVRGWRRRLHQWDPPEDSHNE